MEKFIGTSGYNYAHWEEGVFYPQGLHRQEFLPYYCQYFNSVELNVTFYRLPSEKVFISWRKRTPSSFKFVIKGSRFITHIKRLKDVRSSLELFYKRAFSLENKLILTLWQFPASFKLELGRLKEFVRLIKKNKVAKGLLHAFEFRDNSWFSSSVFSLLEENNMSLCIADSPVWNSVEILTADFLYLRFHGGRVLYGSEYSEEELTCWKEKVKTWQGKIKKLFAFFNNDAYGFAVKNALRFKELLSEF